MTQHVTTMIRPAQTVGLVENMGEQTITSLEIAKVMGKPHNDLLKAIRKMEPAWESEHLGKFSLMQIREELPNGGFRLRPCYALTKTESLYIATKFNDVARARLVLRWEELERGLRAEGRGEPLLLETEAELLQRSDSIRRQQIGSENAPADGCLTASEVAASMGLTVKDLNTLLVTAGVQFWNGGRYKLTEDYRDAGVACDRAFHYFSLEGEKKQRFYLVWTQQGVDMIRDLIGR